MKATLISAVILLLMLASYFVLGSSEQTKISSVVPKSNDTMPKVPRQLEWQKKKELFKNKTKYQKPNKAYPSPLANKAKKTFSPASSFGQGALNEMKKTAVQQETRRISSLVALDDITLSRLESFLDRSFDAQLTGGNPPEQTLDDVIGEQAANQVRAAAQEQLQATTEALRIERVDELVRALGLDDDQQKNLMSTLEEIESRRSSELSPNSPASLEGPEAFNALIRKTNADSRRSFDAALGTILNESQIAEYRRLNPGTLTGESQGNTFSLAY